MTKKLKKLMYTAFSLILAAMGVLCVSGPASADTMPVPLSSLSAGNTVNFGGYAWIVLDPGTGYLLKQDNYGFDRQFDPNSDQVAVYDPTDTNNIANYLNTTFYNSFPLADQALIQSHQWESSANCKIGMISAGEWRSYSKNYNSTSGFVDGPHMPFWTRSSSGYISYNVDTGYIYGAQFVSAAYGGDVVIYATDKSTGVRPALYLNPGVLVSGGNGGNIKPYNLTVSTSTTTLTAGTPVNVTITAQDACGNVAAGYTGTVHFTGTDAKAVLPADYTFTGSGSGKDNGTHTFTGVTLKTAGTQTVAATDKTTSTANTIAGTSGSLTVSPTAAGSLTVTASTMNPARMPFNVTITAKDAYGNTVPGYTHTVRLSSTDPNAVLPPDYTFTGSGPGKDNGTHTFTGVMLKKTGSQTVFASDMVAASITGSTGSLTVPEDSAKDITAFTVPGQVGSSAIDTAGHAVTFHMPYGTDISSPMIPTISVSANAIVSPTSKTPENFSSPVNYTVTAEDDSTQTWTVTCIVDPNLARDIITFTVPGQVGSSTIDATGHTVTFHMPYGTDASSLTPTISISADAAVLPISGKARDFRNPVNYTVTARDYSTRTWTVTCVIDPEKITALRTGDTVRFGGNTWIVLDPGTGYLLMQDRPLEVHAFDPDNTQSFDPTDTNNIAWFLNNTYYNSLPSADQTLIRPYYWTIGNEQNESASTVNCKIGLLGYSEWQNYRSVLKFQNSSSWVWMRTPCSSTSWEVWFWYTNNDDIFHVLSQYSLEVKPALYLNPDTLVSGGNGGTVDAAPPAVTSQPASLTMTAGQTATFSVMATGDSLSYQWRKSTDNGSTWNNIAGEASASYTTGVLATSDSGCRYDCEVTNTLNGTSATATSNAVTLTVNPVDITTAIVRGFVAPAEGASPAAVSSLSSGAPSQYTVTSITWSPEDNPFKPATSYTATVVLTSATGYAFPAALTPTVDAGTAAVGTVSGTGSGNTLTFTVTFPAPVPVTSITITGAGNASSVQIGNILQMSAEVLPATATDPGVTWSVIPGTGTATIDSNGLLTGTGDGTVIVKATANDGFGVIGSLQVTVTNVPDHIVLLAGSDQSAQILAAFDTALKVRVEDAGNKPVSGVTVTFMAPMGGATGTFANRSNSDTVVTRADGTATASAFTASGIADSYTVAAYVDGVSERIYFNLTNIPISAPVITSSRGGTDITTSDKVIIDISSLSAGQSVYYTTNGDSSFTASPPSEEGCIRYQEPFSLPEGNYQVSAAVYSSSQGIWGYPGSAAFTVTTGTANPTDADTTTGAKTLLAAASLNPVKGTDTNLINKAQSLVDAVYSGVTVTLDSSANSQISGDGTIIYGSSVVTGDVTFRLTKNAASAIQTVSITVPAAASPTIYSVSIGSLTGGSITALPATTGAGATVVLTITPDSGKRLKAGTLKYNDGTTDYSITGTSFTMPAVNVTIMAEFENVPANTYTVSIGTLSGGSITALPATTGAGATVVLTITPDSGKRLKAGTLKYNDGTMDHAITGTSFTLPAANVTVTAEFENVPANTDGSGNNTDTSGTSAGTPPAVSSDPPATIKETPQSGNTPPSVTGITVTTAESDSNGNASAAVTENQVTDAVKKAVETAAQKAAGTQARVEIKVTAAAGIKSMETSIPKAAFQMVSNGEIDALTVSSPVADITFDDKALSAISAGVAGDVKIAASKVDASALSEEARKEVEDRPVFDFSVTSGDNTISQFGGNVTVSVPYTPKAGEDPNAIVIYFINAEGKLETVSNCKYDPSTGKVTFATNHFSKYAVGYNKVSFTDVTAGVWYEKAVGFIAARRITTGTGNSHYNPEAKLTRAEFLVMMMRAYGITPDSNVKDNFADAGSTWYTGYLAAAKRLGISEGVGSNMFAPDKEFTRQEMVTLLYNALKVIDELPEGDAGKLLSDFTDAGQITSWAKDAMALLVETGTIGGNNGKLTPASTTTRAEMAQVLYNLLSK